MDSNGTFFKNGRSKIPETERRVKANQHDANSLYNYANNYISTSKYNVATFLPKNLFEQFQRIANAYFLFLLVLQMIPEVSSLTPLTTVVPLMAVLLVSAVKDAHDDIQRHRSDGQVNNRSSWILREGKLVEERWHKVVVGDIIRLENNHFVTADLLLLSASEPNSLCYIETAELDGETNLKVRQALMETAEMADDIEELSKFDGEVVCEPPNNNLNKFEGTLTWNDETYALDNDKILLRGCVLRNTTWCYGLVLFAGRDTKLMMNCGKTTFKRTHIDRMMNVIIIGIFIFLLLLCLICTICAGIWEKSFGSAFQTFLPWDSFVPGSVLSDGGDAASKESAGATVIAVMTFFSYIIVLNTVVPISLYVSVEMIRFVHSFWINWDQKMYFAAKDTAAKTRTTTLNEELGQIEYIFSDKTGTLTQNLMTFNKCSINGRSYGDAYDDRGNPVDVTDSTPKVDLSENPMYQPSFEFYDGRLWELIKAGDPHIHKFFRLLALCHTVMPEDKNGDLEYQAQSPDEGALVSAARNFGFVFRSRTSNTITIEVMGHSEIHELLCILDFNNVRKRMSVVLRKDDKITLYCKGADSTVYERLDPSCAELMELTTSNLNDFAQSGLRTLCLAAKDIDPAFYKLWKRRHHEASCSLVNRDAQLDAVYEEIEQGMLLLGATAIEDKLQDGVPEAIANLASAGIKIWVLTGDKQETAVNIGYSCQLLREEMEEVYVIDAETHDGVQKQLEDALSDIKDKAGDVDTSKQPLNNPPSALNGRSSRIMDSCVASDVSSFAIVINGCSLVFALGKDLEMLLLDVASRCQAVICCRVTPLQKSLVVELVKRNRKSITLAIGDGANDVSMIKAAHIGVGISGQEGMQAVLASDFSLAQFCYLERLLLVHGRWSYLRMCKFLKYFFYKNFAFTLCHVWFAIFCGFSAQTLYDEAFISLYNVCYTSLPVLVLAIFDQDVSDRFSLHYPKLYAPGQRDLFFNKWVFGQSVAEGIISSLLLFMIPFGAFRLAIDPNGQDIGNHKALGFVVASSLIVTVTLRCAIDTIYWTGFNHFVIWGSIAFYFIFILIFYSEPFGYSYMGTATMLMSTAAFWLTMILTVVVLLTPVVLVKLYQHEVTPTLADKVRLKQKLRQPARRGPRVLRRASTVRGGTLAGASMRSLRSGYAFAHSQGFGELITTGSMMQIRPRPRSARVRTRGPPRPRPGDAAATTLSDLREDDDVDDRRTSSNVVGGVAAASGSGSTSGYSGGSRKHVGGLSELSVKDLEEDARSDEGVHSQLVSACGSAVTRLSTGPPPLEGSSNWTEETGVTAARRRDKTDSSGHIELGRVSADQTSDAFFDESSTGGR